MGLIQGCRRPSMQMYLRTNAISAGLLIYLRSQPAIRAQPGHCQIKVRRDGIFEDSYAETMRQTPNDLKK